MKKRFLVLIALLLINSVFAEDFHNSKSLEIDIDVDGSIEVVPKSSSYSVKNIKAYLRFFPKDSFNQEVLEMKIKPDNELVNDTITFEWEEPSEDELSFGFDSRIKTYNKIVEVRDKVSFPIKDLSDELEVYTKPSETIDSDDGEIIRLASRLVKGEDDLYEAVFKLAEWTKNNVEYNLSTLTADVSQKASWVLDNREGVCDEITSLFIALCRAVGIPAKFVSGVAYTNSELFDENWGNHGWSEVYFPGYGWVPFDVTYGEFGFIDPAHVKMRESVDSASSSTEYEWISRNVDLKTKGLEIKTELAEDKGKVREWIELEAEAVKKETGFGSYNLIEVKVKNLKGYYAATELYLSKTNSVKIDGENKKSILLKPREEKSVSWIIKVSEDLNDDFVYTFPFVVSTLRNTTAETSFNSENKGRVYSLVEIGEIFKNREEEEEKTYSKKVDVDCDIDKEEFYAYDGAVVDCDIMNTGNVFLDGLEVCFEEECSKFDLGIMQSRSVTFSVNYSKSGKMEVPVKARNKDVSKFNYIDFRVLDEPKIEVSELEFPMDVNFDQKYEVVFVLEKESSSNPVDIDVEFEHSGIKDEWTIEELFEDRRFVLNLQGSDMKAGKNDFKILVKYKDKNSKVYETEKEFSIELVDVNLWQRVYIFFNGINRSSDDFDFRSLMIMLFISGVVFTFIVFYVFHKSKR